jgi:quercetin dioxygenase-like cupin family protein
MSMKIPFTVRQPGEGRTIAVVGDIYRFLAVGAETDGRYCTWEATVPPGGGPPPHTHSREVESFYILEGEITVHLEARQLVAKAGAFVNIPIGSLHSFRNESGQTARMLISVAPAGLEEMFFEVGQPMAPDATITPPATPAEIEHLLAIAAKYGIEFRLPQH